MATRQAVDKAYAQLEKGGTKTHPPKGASFLGVQVEKWEYAGVPYQVLKMDNVIRWIINEASGNVFEVEQ